MQNGRIVVSGPIGELRDMSLMRELSRLWSTTMNLPPWSRSTWRSKQHSKRQLPEHPQPALAQPTQPTGNPRLRGLWRRRSGDAKALLRQFRDHTI
ncbi:hypothetical protein [Mesorhizobium sp. 128a]